MSALLVGYARCSTDQQDLTAQRDALLAMGVEPERIYVDHGLTGTNRERPGLREALAACRAGDTLVVTKLDRLARSLPDARAIADELTTRQISLSRRARSTTSPTPSVGCCSTFLRWSLSSSPTRIGVSTVARPGRSAPLHRPPTASLGRDRSLLRFLLRQ